MPRSKAVSSLPETVGDFFKREGLDPEDGILVALSGGSDSVGLLLSCVDRFGTQNLRAAHFDHGLRGGESDGDREFCRDLCERLGVGFSTGSGDVAGEARIRKTGIEDAGRILRYDFLFANARAFGMRYVLTGHTADDQAETVLGHFIRGSKLGGLSGMPKSDSRGLLRPFLSVRKREIVEFLKEKSQPYRNDSSNADPSFSRNRIRSLLIPEIEAMNSGFSRTMERFSEYARELDAHLENEVSEYLNAQERPGSFDVSEFAGLSEFFRKEVLSRLYVGANGNGIGLSEGMVSEMLRFCSMRYGGKSKTFGALRLERLK